MTTTYSAPLSRTLFAAAIALVGTVASFSATTNAAHAQAPAARLGASLVTPLAEPRKEIVNGVQWKCAGDQCAAPLDGSRPVVSCARFVREFGPVTRFTSGSVGLAAEQLERCNAAA